MTVLHITVRVFRQFLRCVITYLTVWGACQALMLMLLNITAVTTLTGHISYEGEREREREREREKCIDRHKQAYVCVV